MPNTSARMSLLVVFAALFLFPHVLLAIDETSTRLIEEYRTAAASRNPDAIKSAWSNLQGNRPAVEYMNNNMPNLAGHYAQRTGIENLNAIHRAQAAQGEIVPFEQIAGENFNRPRTTTGTPRQRVSGNPSLANLADPSVSHHRVGNVPNDPGLARLGRGEGQKLPVGQYPETKLGSPAGSGAATGTRITSGANPNAVGSGAQTSITAGERTAVSAGSANTRISGSGMQTTMTSGPNPNAIGSGAQTEIGAGNLGTQISGTRTPTQLSTPTGQTALSPGSANTRISQGGMQTNMTSGPNPSAVGRGAQTEIGVSNLNTNIGSGRMPTQMSAGGAEAGGATLSQIRMQSGQPTPSLLEGGAASSSHTSFGTKVGRGLGTGIAAIGIGAIGADGIQKESESAAREGRDFSPWNAAGNTVRTVMMGGVYDATKERTEQIIEESDAAGESRLTALGRAGLDTLGQGVQAAGSALTTGVYDTSKVIYQDAAREELARAQAAGEQASGLRANAVGFARSVGAVTGFSTILDATMYDSDADRAAAESAAQLQATAKGALEAGLGRTRDIENQMEAIMNQSNFDSTTNQNRLAELQTQYDQARNNLLAQAARVNNSPNINKNDPELIAIMQAVKGVPADPMAGIRARQEAARKAEEARRKAEEEARKAEEDARQVDQEVTAEELTDDVTEMLGVGPGCGCIQHREDMTKNFFANYDSMGLHAGMRPAVSASDLEVEPAEVPQMTAPEDHHHED